MKKSFRFTQFYGACGLAVLLLMGCQKKVKPLPCEVTYTDPKTGEQQTVQVEAETPKPHFVESNIGLSHWECPAGWHLRADVATRTVSCTRRDDWAEWMKGFKPR